MEKVYFVVSSVTYAMKGRRILASVGIKSEIGKRGRRADDKSCRYTIAVSSGNAEAAERMLRANSVRILERKDGGTT